MSRYWTVNGRRFNSVDELKKAEDEILREVIGLDGDDPRRNGLTESRHDLVKTRLEAGDDVGRKPPARTAGRVADRLCWGSPAVRCRLTRGGMPVFPVSSRQGTVLSTISPPDPGRSDD
jgi:hypothetical protein